MLPTATRPREPIERRWIALSLLGHLAVLLALLLLTSADSQADKPVAMVEVRLVEERGSDGSAGGSAGGGGDGQTSESPAAESPATAASGPVEPTVAETQPTAETRVEEVASPILAPPATEASPVIVPPPKLAKPVVAPRPPPPKPAPPARQQVVETPPPAPAPPEERSPSPNPAQVAAATSPEPGAAPSGTSSGAAGGAQGIGMGPRGSGTGTFGTGQGPGDDYLDALRRWLMKYKRYPPEALKRKEEGSVLVAFVLARDGTVLDARIERGSGFPLIDQAVLDMMRNASPVPPVPAAYDGDRLSISMPVRFSLGFFDRIR